MKFQVMAAYSDGNRHTLTVYALDANGAAWAVRNRGLYPYKVRQSPGSSSIMKRAKAFTAGANAHARNTVIGIALAVVVVSLIVFLAIFVTQNSRLYRNAQHAYVSAQYEEALAMIDRLPAHYQSRASVDNLKSNCHVQLAISEMAGGEYAKAFRYLERIPSSHYGYDTIAVLRERARKQTALLKAQEEEARAAAELAREQQQREAEARQRAASSTARHSQPRQASSRVSTQSDYKGFSESELRRIHAKLMRKGYTYEDALLTTKDMIKYPNTRAVLRHWLRNN